MSAYEDKELTCKDCNTQFIFTAGEQAFYASKTDKQTGEPFTEPKRCPDCRKKKKARSFDKNFKDNEFQPRQGYHDEGF